MYLTLAEKQQVFANVREMLQVYGGVWTTPDLTTQDRLRHLRQNYPALYELGETLDRMTGRSITDNHFESADQVKQFANEQGFCIQEHSMLDVIDQISCLVPLGIDPNVAESLLAASSVLTLTLSNT